MYLALTDDNEVNERQRERHANTHTQIYLLQSHILFLFQRVVRCHSLAYYTNVSIFLSDAELRVNLFSQASNDYEAPLGMLACKVFTDKCICICLIRWHLEPDGAAAAVNLMTSSFHVIFIDFYLAMPPT